MTDRSRSPVIEYGSAVAAVAVAWLFGWLLDPVLGEQVPYPTFFIAVIFAAWYGGLRSALLALVLSVPILAYFFVSPRHTFFIQGVTNLTGMGLFVFVSLASAGFSEVLHITRRQAEATARDLRHKQQQLEQQMVERRQTEAELRMQREWFRGTFASIGDAVLTTDVKGNITFLNPVAQALTGWSQNEAWGQPLETVFKIVNEQTRQPLENLVQRALREGRMSGLANHSVLIAKNGTEHAIDDSVSPICNDIGEIIGFVLVFRDVTEHRREEMIRFQLAAIVDSSDDAIIGKTLDSIITSWNRGAEWLYGYPAEEIIGKSVSLIIPPERADELRLIMGKIRRGEAIDHIETVRLRRDGTRVDVSVSVSPIKDGQGHTIGASAIARDITRQKQAEEALRVSEERLRLALEAGRMGTFEWNIQTNGVIWSPSLEAIHGLKPGARPDTFTAYQQDIHPDDHERVLRSINETIDQGRDHQIEYRLRWPDGSIHWVEGRGRLFRDDTGKPLRMIGVCMDITQRKRTEQDLRFLADASATLSELVDYRSTLQKLAELAVPSFADWCAVDMLDPDGSLCRLALSHVDPVKIKLGYELHRRYPPDPNAPVGVWNILRTGKAELLPEIPDSLLAATAKDEDFLRILRRLGLQSYLGVPLTLRGKTLGVVTFIAAESGRRYDANDLAMAQDLAHRAAIAIENAHLYSELQEAGRHKDEFIAILAHELRNPLAPICNALQIMQFAGENRQTLDQARSLIERQVEQMVRLIDDLLDLSRISRGKVELRKEQIDLATIVQSALETSRPLIEAAGHELTLTLPPEPLYLHADPIRLAQVFSNLINNACKYTEKSGHIWLTAERHGQEVVVRVKDDGIGISAEKLPHVFEIFTQGNHSLQQGLGGLGIGLSLSRQLTELHGGTIEACSESPGKGSEFTVRLPVASEPEEYERLQELNTGSEQPAGHAWRILVVDDNVDAAESLAMLLQMLGNEIWIAHDGLEAVQAASTFEPDMVLLDIGLPKMNGYEAARRIRRQPRGKDMVLVALTGWGQEEDRRRSRQAGFDHHLVKPVNHLVLQELLASART